MTPQEFEAMAKLMTPEQVKQLMAAMNQPAAAAKPQTPQQPAPAPVQPPAPAVPAAQPPAVQAPQTYDMAAYGEGFADDMKNSLSMFDEGISLPKVKILKDSAKFEFSEDDIRSSFDGYILNAQKLRARWAKSIDQQTTPEDKLPECSSSGSIGTKYGHCINCQYNFQNARNNPALKDAKNNCVTSLNLYVLIEDQEIPVFVKYSATTLWAYQTFCVNCMAAKMPPVLGWKVRFTLSKEEKNGMRYSVGKFDRLEKVSPEKYKQLKAIAQNFEGAFHRNEESLADSAEKPF